jgi:autotransporter-associated beta strand protein
MQVFSDGYSVLSVALRPAAGASSVRRRMIAGTSLLVLAGASTTWSGGSALADEILSGSRTISNQVYSNETITGATGSGGGAGLGGAVFIGAGASVTISNTDFIGNTAVGGTGGVGTSGGGLNGRTTGTAGAAGQAGSDSTSATAYVNGGDGGAGGNGFGGADATAGVGGAGGAGGNGSGGSATTADIVKTIAEQAKAVFDGAGDGTVAGLYTALAGAFTTAAATASAGGVTAVGPAPNVPLGTALGTVASQFGTLAAESTTSAGEEAVKAAYEAAYLLAVQVTSYETGAAGNGGAGGFGGDAGDGSYGYGGGGGGNGGAGGDAISASSALGGTGGDGGDGGRGGFGAGGGRGGNGGAGGDDGVTADNGPHDGPGGTGGAAGFGGGVGSTGDGTANGSGGGGGSGYGGAIFVQNGGSLTITGDALFDRNSVFGGSSENGGEAGQAAGSDLFMMKGSTVTLRPGAGNTIVFNGTIADDSRASISGSSIASGQGAGLTVADGRVVFNGENTYTGQTKIEDGGVLQAQDRYGIHKDSNINLAGGVLQSNGTFDRYLGTGSDRLQWTDSGGFSAIGGDLTVKLNNNQTLSWGSGGFVPVGETLIFGSDTADSDVHFVNAINLAGGTGRIVNVGNAEDGSNLAYLDGKISNGSLILGDGTTEGTIVLTAANTYAGTTNVMEGTTVRLEGAGSIASSSLVTADGTVDISGTNAGASFTTLTGGGEVVLGDKTLTISNGSTDFAGVISGAGGLIIAGGEQTLSGANSYTGATTIDADAALALTGDGSIAGSSGVTADGTFDISDADAGVSITTLAGAGDVVLGANTLTLSSASTTFSGVIDGSGGLTVSAGTQTLTGANTYEGATNIAAGATLALSAGGSIADSSSVVANGTFDIAGASGDVSITTLDGSGAVTLGTNDLTLTNASTTFGGVIGGTGGLIVEAGTQTLTGANTYAGATEVDDGAALVLAGNGSLASSSKLAIDGTFDISGTNAGASITTLAGDGIVTLGGKTLTLTAAADTFAGAIGGTGGLAVTGGTQTLTGNNSYTGVTDVLAGASLALSGSGDIAESAGLNLAGAFDISGTTAGASLVALAGLGSITLGEQDLTITNASATFSGSIGGTGDFIVAGGTQGLLDATISTGIVAKDNGKIIVEGGSIDTGTSSPALSIVNGGSIATSYVSLDTDGATAHAAFDEAGRTATFLLGSGTSVIANNGVLLDVQRSGAGSDGVVFFTIDSGTSAVGDVRDTGTKTGEGGTIFTIAEGSTWTGVSADVGFVIEAGATANFGQGSTAAGIEAAAGATILGGTLDNPLEISGNVTVDNATIFGSGYSQGDLNLNGLLSVGQSPGSWAFGGNYNAGIDAQSLFEVVYGVANPIGGTNYDQLNIGGNATGTTPVTLARYASTRSTPLGDLGAVELIKIGGEVTGDFVQTNRFTQHGHEILLDERTRDADASILVPMTGQNEEQFFGSGPITVYGLRAIIQDETFGLAELAGSANQAYRDMLGTFADRRGFDLDEMRGGWARFGTKYTDMDDVIASTQTVSFGQVGIDLFKAGGWRLGALGSFGESSSDIRTETGTNNLRGDLWSAGAFATWTSGGAYFDAVVEYGTNSWDFSPTAASKLTVDGSTITAAVEGGYAFATDLVTIRPWGQVVWQVTNFDTVDSDWVDTVDFEDTDSLLLRGGVRAEHQIGAVGSYLGVGMAHDVNDDKTTVVDGYALTAGMAATRVELAAGFQAAFNPNTTFFADVKGAYGIGDGTATAYDGTVGLRAKW